MSEESLRLIEECVTLHFQPDHNWNVARTLIRDVRRSLDVDSQHREEVAAEDIGICLETTQGTSPDLQGTYTILKT